MFYSGFMIVSRLSASALASLLGGWRGNGPAYESIADAIRVLCLDNRIAPRTALPAERELAARLGVSRTTVAAAYRSLRDSGHIESLRGSGSVTLPLGRSGQGVLSAGDGVIDLQQATPAAWPGLAGVIGEAAGMASSVVSTTGYDTIGRLGLRQAIADHLTGRGLPTELSEVMVTSGAQTAISLIATALLVPGDRVLMETPTYPNAAEAFRRRGARLIGVPVDVDEGWDLERAVHAFQRAAPSAAYVMPDFHNPTGRTMSPAERTAFAEHAAGMGTLLIVDETTAELSIDRPTDPPPLASLSTQVRGLRTVTLGSLGKTVWGGLRIGWIRADPDLIRRLAAARAAHDLGTAPLEQLIAERVFARMPEVLEQRRRVLAEGRDAAVEEFARLLPSWRVPRVDGGISLWVGLGAPLSSRLVLGARSRGVLLSSGARFAVDGGHERHLRIPFGGQPATLRRAIALLAESWAEVAFDAHEDRLDAVV